METLPVTANSDLAEIMRKPVPGTETVLDIASQLLGENGEDVGKPRRVALNVTRRLVNPEPPPAPIKAPSPKRAHTFNDCQGFADYLAKFGTDATVVLVDLSEGTMQAILDENSKDGFEVVRFEALEHPLFRPWSELLEEDADEIGIMSFATFVAKNRHTVMEPLGRDLMLSCAQVRMSRSVEMHVGQGKTALNGIMIKTIIQGASQGTGERDDYLPFPDLVKIKAPIYLDTDPVEIEVAMSLSGHEQTGVLVALSSPNLVALKLALFESMRATIITKSEAAQKKITFALGKANHETWIYLPAATSR